MLMLYPSVLQLETINQGQERWEEWVVVSIGPNIQEFLQINVILIFPSTSVSIIGLPSLILELKLLINELSCICFTIKQ